MVDTQLTHTNSNFDTQPVGTGSTGDTWDRASMLGNDCPDFRNVLPPCLSLRNEQGENIMTWEHSNPGGSKSKVEFTLVKSDEFEVAGQLIQIKELFNTDFIMREASNPIITAFFRLMLDRSDVKLRSLENCKVKNAFIQNKDPSREIIINNVAFNNCSLVLDAGTLTLSDVQFNGCSYIELKATQSTLRTVKISEECVVNGNLGKAVIEADCEFHGYSVGMDFTKTEWRIDNNKKSLTSRISSALFSANMVTPQFSKDAGLRTATEEEEKIALEKSKERLDASFG